jgi:DNA (cytosine-5)-methyltransferase 1
MNQNKEGQKRRPIAIDLFSGAGGLSLGMESAGFEVMISIEIDPVHSAIHNYNFPNCANICRDISNVSSEELWNILNDKDINEVDLLAGGPPCQGFSQMGYRHIEDPRNKLVFEYVRVVRDIKPKYFIFENVPGIVSGKHRGFIEGLCHEFIQMGYNTIVPVLILNAADFGVAQNRSRLILLGWRKDMPKPVYPETLFEKTTANSANSKSREPSSLPPWLGASDVLSDLEGVSVFIGKDEGISPDKLNYCGLRCNFSFDPNGVFHLCHRRTFTEKLIYGHLSSTHTEQSIVRFKNVPQGVVEPTTRLFKLHPYRPSNTLRAGTDSKRGAHTAPRPIHYSHPRCISIREAARLHSFPDWFQFHRTIWHGHRQIGNSVPPLLAKEVAQSLIGLLGYDLSKIPVDNLPPSDLGLLSLTMHQACNLFGVRKDVIGKRNRNKGNT